MTDKPNIEAMSREFCELAGLKCPTCEKYDCPCFLPDFTDAREVLKVMRKREDWIEFCMSVGVAELPDYSVGLDGYHMIDVDYILDDTGKLRDAAIEWMKGRKKEATFVYYAFKKEEAKADE